MFLQEWQCRDYTPFSMKGFAPASLQEVVGQNRRIFAAWRGLKAIAEAHAQGSGGVPIHVNVNSPPSLDKEGSKVVDAVDVIGMGMSEEYRVEPINVRIEKLLAQIRRGIDQGPGHAACAPALDQ